MKYWAEFYDDKKQGLCGTDGVCWVDGRLNMYNKVQSAIRRIKMIDWSRRRISYLRIHRSSSYSRLNPITDYIPVDLGRRNRLTEWELAIETIAQAALGQLDRSNDILGLVEDWEYFEGRDVWQKRTRTWSFYDKAEKLLSNKELERIKKGTTIKTVDRVLEDGHTTNLAWIEAAVYLTRMPGALAA